MATYGPAPSAAAYERIHLPFTFGIGGYDGFQSTSMGKSGVAWRKYASSTAANLAVPTLDVGLNQIPTTALGLTMASNLVTAVVTMYWLYLQDIALLDINSLKGQQQTWLDMGLTEPDLVYLSKHNQRFTGAVDPSRLDPQPLNLVTGSFREGGVNIDKIRSFANAAVPALNNTELIRVVVHCGTTNIANDYLTGAIQRAMDDILDWGLNNPTACRIELVFKGSQSCQSALPTLLSTPRHGVEVKVNTLRRDNWKIHDNDNWTARLVTKPGHPNGPSFTVSNTRFGLRYEAEHV